VDSGLDRALELYQVGFSREQIHGSLEALAEQEIPFYTAYIFYDPISHCRRYATIWISSVPSPHIIAT